MSHTPGPWELWDGCSWRRFGSGTTQKMVVEPIVYSERDRHPDLRVSKEDAALICAAPDLLAACEAFTTAMRSGKAVELLKLIDVLHIADAAIAKAKGLTP